MADTTKEQQRAELHKAIWTAADRLRGSVDGWDFKQYVLGMLFYRFISENLAGYLDAQVHASGDASFSYANFDDEGAEVAREQTVGSKGFYILPSQLFCNVVRRAHEDADYLANLNEHLEANFRAIEDSAMGHASEGDLKGLFDDIDVNGRKLGENVLKRNEKLLALMDCVAAIDFGGAYEDSVLDPFGDAMEYLMTMYASNAGKSGGEFYTPQEVGTVLARIALDGRKEVHRAYDACCGSGGLLCAIARETRTRGADGRWVNHVTGGLFGQEINLTSYNLARMNMFLHDINYDKFDIALGDTLLDPQHWDYEPFDAILSNVPFSIKWNADDPTIQDDSRFTPAGVLAPASKADLAFTMHMLSWLSEDGTAAIVQFPGALYRSGREAKIREYMVRNNYVQAVIALPANLFFGTSIATAIIVLKKSKTDANVLFVDASKEFVHVANNNKLTDANIDAICKLYFDRAEIQYKTKLVPNAEIIANGSNLSVNTYVEKEDTTEKITFEELNARIETSVANQADLRTRIANLLADFESGEQQ